MIPAFILSTCTTGIAHILRGRVGTFNPVWQTIKPCMLPKFNIELPRGYRATKHRSKMTGVICETSNCLKLFKGLGFTEPYSNLKGDPILVPTVPVTGSPLWYPKEPFNGV